MAAGQMEVVPVALHVVVIPQGMVVLVSSRSQILGVVERLRPSSYLESPLRLRGEEKAALTALRVLVVGQQATKGRLSDTQRSPGGTEPLWRHSLLVLWTLLLLPQQLTDGGFLEDNSCSHKNIQRK